MKCFQLAPVGNPVSYKQSKAHVDELFHGRAFFVDSGSSALALALMAAIDLQGKKNRHSAPEVLMPAYACPDLVSAIVFAGAKPVLVDLEVNTPWMDLVQLKEAVNQRTVAIIAVNFLGISERLTALKAISTAHDLFLIEDNAQSMQFDDADSSEQSGDITIRSFGRGKPLSILGGGVVYSQRQDVGAVLDRLTKCLAEMPFKPLVFLGKVIAYNVLLNPACYWIPASLPFLHLGETRFKHLNTVMRLDVARKAVLAENYQIFKSGCYDKTHLIATMITQLDNNTLVDLSALSMETDLRRLRYPILLPSLEVRDSVLRRAKSVGLGVSIMYGKVLVDFDALLIFFSQKEKDKKWEAKDFANRLITLPTHAYVNKEKVTRLAMILAEELC